MAPKPPKHLDRAAKAKWKALQDEYAIIDGGGLLLLTTAMEAWQQMNEARELLQSEGMTVMNDCTGHRRAHPAAALLKEARTSFFKAISMLGLDVDNSEG